MTKAEMVAADKACRALDGSAQQGYLTYYLVAYVLDEQQWIIMLRDNRHSPPTTFTLREAAELKDFVLKRRQQFAPTAPPAASGPTGSAGPAVAPGSAAGPEELPF